MGGGNSTWICNHLTLYARSDVRACPILLLLFAYYYYYRKMNVVVLRTYY